MNLPEPFIQSLKDLPGFDEADFKAVHQSGSQITSVRLNPGKTCDIQYLAAGQAGSIFNIQSGGVPWSSNGVYLNERPSFTLDPLFHAGAYYVQEASSMFLEEALVQTTDLTKPLRVLDLCAAPGGKSTLLQSLISKESLLVSNEVIKTRVNILTENITRWGAANVIVTNNDPADFSRLPAYFDVIVVDAPCSGSGLFRKDPDAIAEWSENNVELCARRQQRILADILPSLKPGGILIYSTCSYSKAEDEHIAAWLTAMQELETVRLCVNEAWGIVETVTENKEAFGYRFYPGKVKGEGFYLAAFKKPGVAEAGHFIKPQKSRNKNNQQLTAAEKEAIRPFLAEAGEFLFIKQQDEALALPLQLEEDLSVIQSALYIKKAGVKLGTVIRNELIPAHDLAVSNIIAASVPRLETDRETALQYLRRAEISLSTALKGWVLLTYGLLPLGWVKLMPNRINNYYPKEWRILHK